MNRAVFLDRDGTLIEHEPYLSSPERVRLAPGAAEAMLRLRALNFWPVVVTNQSGVARGYFSESAVKRVHRRINELLMAEGSKAEAFYYCPHGPADEGYEGCRCRKPAAGMALQAARDLGLNLNRSWMIGDSVCDIEFGLNSGCRTILVRTGRGRETELAILSGLSVRLEEKSGTMFFVADDLRAAALLVEQAEAGFSI